MLRHNPYTKFMAWMKEHDVTAKEIAALLNHSRGAISKKLNGTGADFTLSEVRKICLEYSISADDYFVAYKVS